MPPSKTYTEMVEELTKRIDDIASLLLSKGDDGHQVTLGEVTRRQDEMIALLRDQNGAVKENSKAIVALLQWQKDHCEMHADLANRVDYVNKKVNVVSVVEALWAPFAAGIAALFRNPSDIHDGPQSDRAATGRHARLAQAGVAQP
jgi:hypothetical protein